MDQKATEHKHEALCSHRYFSSICNLYKPNNTRGYFQFVASVYSTPMGLYTSFSFLGQGLYWGNVSLFEQGSKRGKHTRILLLTGLLCLWTVHSCIYLHNTRAGSLGSVLYFLSCNHIHEIASKTMILFHKGFFWPNDYRQNCPLIVR